MTVVHRARPSRESRLSVQGVLSSEWLKLWSLRSARWAGLLGVLGMALVAVYGASTALPAQTGGAVESSTVGLVALTAGTGWAMLVGGFVSVVAGASEYSSGSARATFTAVPTRSRIVLAKLAVVFAFGAALGLLGVVVSALGVTPILEQRGYTIMFLDPRLLLPATTVPLVLGLTSVVAAAAGMISRSTATGVAFVLVVMTILPFALTNLAMTIQDATPMNLAMLFPTTTAGHGVYSWPGFEVPPNVTGALNSWVLAPWQGGGVLIGWAVLAVVTSVIVVRRRDV